MELLEREAQLNALRDAWAKTRAGSGNLALVSGEAGIGKTSLLARFTREHAGTTKILWGACDALFTPRPLGPLYDIARQGHPELATLLERDANWLTIATAFLTLLESNPTSLIVVIEDAHWADQTTLDLIKFLARRTQQTNALLILTYRDDELAPNHPLRIMLGDLATASAWIRIALTPLSENAVRALATHKNVDPIRLHQQPNGNPFFVTEVLASESGGIPATVRDAVLARVARLSLSARAVLEAAAVLGARIEPWLLNQIVGAEAHAAEECLAVGALQIQDNWTRARAE